MFYPVQKFIADVMLLMVQVLVKEIAWEGDLTRGACLCLCLRLARFTRPPLLPLLLLLLRLLFFLTTVIFLSFVQTTIFLTGLHWYLPLT